MFKKLSYIALVIYNIFMLVEINNLISWSIEYKTQFIV